MSDAFDECFGVEVVGIGVGAFEDIGDGGGDNGDGGGVPFVGGVCQADGFVEVAGGVDFDTSLAEGIGEDATGKAGGFVDADGDFCFASDISEEGELVCWGWAGDPCAVSAFGDCFGFDLDIDPGEVWFHFQEWGSTEGAGDGEHFDDIGLEVEASDFGAVPAVELVGGPIWMGPCSVEDSVVDDDFVDGFDASVFEGFGDGVEEGFVGEDLVFVLEDCGVAEGGVS